VLPVAEIEFAGRQRVVSYAAKWDAGSDATGATPAVVPRPYPGTPSATSAVDAGPGAWAAVGGRGYGRVDLRTDDAGQPYVLEVNPNPDLAPDAGLARMAEAAGWGYAGWSADRGGGPSMTPPWSCRRRRRAPGPRGRPGRAGRADPPWSSSPRTRRIVALEVLDSYMEHPGKDYHALGAFTHRDVLLGYACYGPTPCTAGTWDLYWIAVSGEARGRGIGTLLMEEIERRLVDLDARLVVDRDVLARRLRPDPGVLRAARLRGRRESCRTSTRRGMIA
jgi:D-alanine-D-alanine ligase